MTTTCITWSQPDDKHFRGLCGNEFRRETPPAGVRGSDCTTCAAPIQIFGNCSSCLPAPSAIYRVTVSLGPGVSAAGCCDEYQREFLVFAVAACRWESEERELGASAGYYSLPVICTTESRNRARIVLLNTITYVAGIPQTQWIVQVNWCTRSSAGFSGYITRHTAQSRGKATKLDCSQPVATFPVAGFSDVSFGVEPYLCSPCGITAAHKQFYCQVSPS